jgi:Rrf2 family iron-sulfur cluster assembly transcriptional regulator
MPNILQISRGCEYALAAMRVLANLSEDEVMQADQIAETANIPRKFTANILTHLVKFNLLEARRGARRGYRLARPASQISVLEVIEAYDGEFTKPWCFLDSQRTCSETRPCTLHFTWLQMKESVRSTLSTKTVEDLANSDIPILGGNKT